MNIKEQLRRAIENHDIEQLDTIVLRLTYRFGLDYWQVYALAHDVSGIGVDEWDELLHECDERSRK